MDRTRLFSGRVTAAGDDFESVVVTGAAGGIGQAVTSLLLERRYRVVGIDRDGADFGDPGTHRGFTAVEGDVRNPEVVGEAIEAATRDARLVGWVNNAAAFPRGRLTESAHGDLDVNLLAVIDGSRAAVRHFLSSGGGSIVSVSSIHATRAFPAWSMYAVAKAGVEALMRSIAVDFGGLGIRANCVAPGLIATPGNAEYVRALEDSGVPFLAGRPGDVASVIEFLVSDRSAHINGARIAVDGGESIAGVAPAS